MSREAYISGLGIVSRKDVGVNVHRGCHTAMPQSIRDNFIRDSGPQQMGRVGVAKVMEAHPLNSGPLGKPSEGTGERNGAEDPAVWPTEDLVIRREDLVQMFSLGLHGLAMGSEQ